MLVYWLILAYFAVGTFLTHETPQSWRKRTPVLLMAGALLVCFTIGFRYKVGADWETYEFLFSYVGYADLGRALALGDPGYQFINWLVRWLGGEIWAVNLICAVIFTWGLYRFARAQPDPWLAFVVAVPYLIVVVAMGYSRQAVAIGVLMAGLAAIERGASVYRFAFYVGAAALFHKTAVLVFPLVVFAGDRNRILNALAGIAGGILLYDLFLAESVEGFVRNYIQTQYSSQGAAIRVVMNFVPAVLFLMFRKRLQFDPHERRIWFYFSLAALAMPVLLVLLPSSTAVDRVALYLIPIQVAVLPRLQYLFVRRGWGRFLVVLYATLVLFTWLNFAVHSQYWVPYRVHPEIFN